MTKPLLLTRDMRTKDRLTYLARPWMLMAFSALAAWDGNTIAATVCLVGNFLIFELRDRER